MTIPSPNMNFNQPGAQAPSTPNAGTSNFSQTGIPGLDGQYAYAPGSHMTTFIDDLNNRMSKATSGVLEWANGLQAQQAARQASMQSASNTQQNGGMMPAPTVGGDSSMQSFSSMLMFMLPFLSVFMSFINSTGNGNPEQQQQLAVVDPQPTAVDPQPTVSGGKPTVPGKGQPAATGNVRPAATGKGQPAAPGKGQPAAPGKGQPAAPGKGQRPAATGKGQPAAPGKGQPAATGKGRPTVAGKGQPTVAKQPKAGLKLGGQKPVAGPTSALKPVGPKPQVKPAFKPAFKWQ